jgi:hypothetical protein
MIESYVLFACYFVLAIVCWFLFYHHPSHIGIKIRKSQGNEAALGFNVDKTVGFWSTSAAAHANASSSGMQNLSSQGGAGGSAMEQHSAEQSIGYKI